MTTGRRILRQSPDSVVSSSVINPAQTLNWMMSLEQQIVLRQVARCLVFMLRLAQRVVVTISATAGLLAASQLCAVEQVTRWHSSEGVRGQLEQPVTLSWSGVPLRQAVNNLARSQRVAIVLDRRVDPEQEIELALTNVRLDDALLRIATKLKLSVGQAGPVMYLGPVATAEKLQTLVELRQQEIRRLPPEVKAALLAQKPYRWNALSTPRELLAESANDYGIRIDPPAALPHDLWPEIELPPIGLAERISLIAAPFDLTFELSADGRVLRLVPIPTRVVLERSYKVATPATVVDQLKGVLKRSEVIAGDRAIVIRGPAEEHAMAAELLSGKKVRRTHVTQGKTVYQLNIVMPVGRLIRELATKLELQVEIDERAIEQAGISLDRDVSVSVKDATEDQLLQAVLDPAGLTFKRSGKTLVVRPK